MPKKCEEVGGKSHASSSKSFEPQSLRQKNDLGVQTPQPRRRQDASSVALKVSCAGDASQDRIAVALEKRPTGDKGRASVSIASP
jgi:hypothetical protein